MHVANCLVIAFTVVNFICKSLQTLQNVLTGAGMGIQQTAGQCPCIINGAVEKYLKTDVCFVFLQPEHELENSLFDTNTLSGIALR